jgi:hypothetical protein
MSSCIKATGALVTVDETRVRRYTMIVEQRGMDVEGACWILMSITKKRPPVRIPSELQGQ